MANRNSDIARTTQDRFFLRTRRAVVIQSIAVAFASAAAWAPEAFAQADQPSFSNRLKNLFQKKEQTKPAAAKTAPATPPAAATTTPAAPPAAPAAAPAAAAPAAGAALAKADYPAIAARVCSTAATAPHPRSLPRAAEFGAYKDALLTGEMAGDFGEMINAIRFDDPRRADFVDEPAMPIKTTPAATYAPKALEVQRNAAQVAGVGAPAAFVFAISRDAEFKAIAKRRLMNLANLDPAGITGAESVDQASFFILSALSRGLDQMFADLDSSEKTKIRNSIEARMVQFENGLLRGKGSLHDNPANSHGYPILGAMAAAAVLTSDVVPASARLCEETVELFMRVTSPWGGSDGGSAQGTAYAVWDHNAILQIFDTLKFAGGADPTVNPWIRNFGRYLVYFQPPGSPSAVFGDAAELNLNQAVATLVKAYVRRMPPDPLYDWYASNLSGEDRRQLVTLPPRALGTTFPAGTPNGAVFNAIGWAAMHSDLRASDRVSVYFKSSPYGSGGHGHADQNSFVINAKGKQLFADSGYYDFYSSPHHVNWTEQTKAHNAITYDGGKGQPGSSWRAAGAISQFQTTAAYDVVTGDAREAYGADITAARRSVAYLRPNIVVVFDQMASSAPHKWEWNLHSLGTMTVDSMSGTARVSNGGVQACLQLASPQTMTGSASTGFAVAPVRTADAPRPDQWHGRFQTVNATNSFISAAVISVDCTPVSPVFEFPSGKAVVRVAGKTITFNGLSVGVE